MEKKRLLTERQSRVLLDGPVKVWFKTKRLRNPVGKLHSVRRKLLCVPADIPLGVVGQNIVLDITPDFIISSCTAIETLEEPLKLLILGFLKCAVEDNSNSLTYLHRDFMRSKQNVWENTLYIVKLHTVVIMAQLY